MVKVFHPKTNLLSIVIILHLLLYLLLNYRLTWGSEVDGLKERAKWVFGPLPQVIVSARNPIIPGKVRLGKVEKRLNKMKGDKYLFKVPVFETW